VKFSLRYCGRLISPTTLAPYTSAVSNPLLLSAAIRLACRDYTREYNSATGSNKPLHETGESQSVLNIFIKTCKKERRPNYKCGCKNKQVTFQANHHNQTYFDL
jgi:hypothetical protein